MFRCYECEDIFDSDESCEHPTNKTVCICQECENTLNERKRNIDLEKIEWLMRQS